MKPTEFERHMIRYHLHSTPVMTLKGTTILLALIACLLYAAIDCGFF